MQPVSTTALSASEAVRNLNSDNKGKAGGMITFRTGFGLIGPGCRGVAAHVQRGAGMSVTNERCNRARL